MAVASAPEASWRRRATLSGLLVLPSVLVFAVLLGGGLPYCCDADGYLEMIAGHQRDGLFYFHGAVGYRGYLFPYLYSLIPLDHSTIVFEDVRSYSVVAIVLFLLSEFAVLWRLHGNPLLWPCYLAFFVNPLLLIYVPYPLQESFLVLGFVGIVPWVLVLDAAGSRRALPVVLGLFLGVMYMTRASNLVLALPVAVLFAGNVWALSGRERLRSSALFAVTVAILVLPQSAVSQRFHGSLAPYPANAVLSLQMAYGKAYAKYATHMSGRESKGQAMPYWNPLNCTINATTESHGARFFLCTLGDERRRNGIAAVVFTGLLHAYNGLNYDVVEPYVRSSEIPLFSLAQLLSMTVVFLGGYAGIRTLALRQARARDWFLLGIAGASIAVTTITAVETRFGVLATGTLSFLGMELLLGRKVERTEWIALGFGLVLFLLAASLLSVYVLALSGSLSP